jgi:hypothetical protein
MSLPPVYRLSDYIAQGCVTFCQDDADPAHSFVTGGARCPDALPLTQPEPAHSTLGLLLGGAFNMTAVVHVDAGAVRFYCMFNLLDSETRNLLAASARARRFDLLLDGAHAERSRALRLTLDLPFERILAHTAIHQVRRYDEWVEKIHSVIANLPETWAPKFRSDSTFETCHCPVLMLPPSRVERALDFTGARN